MSFPSYEQVVDALHGLFENEVPGLAKYNPAGQLINILKYEPKGIYSFPTLYTLLDSFQRDTSGQVTAMRYRILHRMCFQWQENEQSELALMPFVHSIPAAVDADPTLGGLIQKGLARISDASTGFVVISNTKYRCIDFFADVLTKAPYKSGI